MVATPATQTASVSADRSTLVDALGLACYIAYSYVFWDSPLFLDRHDMGGAALMDGFLLVQGAMTALGALVLMAIWGRVAPLRRNAPVLSVFLTCEVLAVALSVAGNHGEAALISCVGFGLSGFGSSMRLGWEERMAVRGIAATAARAGLGYVFAIAIYTVVLMLPQVGACAAVFALPVVSFAVLISQERTRPNDGVITPDPALTEADAHMGPQVGACAAVFALPVVSFAVLISQERTRPNDGVITPDPALTEADAHMGLRASFRRVPWRIPVFVALSYFCYGATRMNSLSSSLTATTLVEALVPCIAMFACCAGIALAFLSYRKSVQTAIYIAVPLMALAGIGNLFLSGAAHTAVLFVANVGVEMTKYLMFYLMIDVIIKDGAPALLCLALLRFAQWGGSVLGQQAADVLSSNSGVLVAMFVVLMAALMLMMGFSGAGSAKAPAAGRRSEGELGQAADQVPVAASVQGSEAVGEFAQRYGLSPRETDVLRIWLTGRPMTAVEKTLYISQSTVKTHLNHIYAKTGAPNRAQLIELFDREAAEGPAGDSAVDPAGQNRL